MGRDVIFTEATDERKPFRFDASVAAVFPDMLKRSIPGYARTLDIAGRLAQRYVTPGSKVYDLGCSLSAAGLAVCESIPDADISVLGIDTSEPMLARARTIVAQREARHRITLINQDLRETAFDNASMIMLNYTLQFIDPDDRDDVLRRIHDGLNPGGVLLLSEKIAFPAGNASDAIIDLHEDFKRDQGYSEMEIAGKRAALENVLITDTQEQIANRLQQAGFDDHGLWLQHYNFCSYVAFRQP